MKKRKFTLIELLVVVAIIAILASLLLPTMARARYIARNTVCTSNLKQVAMVYVSYADDYDSRYPDVWPEWTKNHDWGDARDNGSKVHPYYLRTSNSRDLRPTLRDYSAGPLNDFMKCPLATLDWVTNTGYFNIDKSNDSRTRSTYMLYPTSNQASKHYLIKERMVKTGDMWMGREYTAKDKEFRIIASDIVKHENNSLIITTQMPFEGRRIDTNQWINGPNGWSMSPLEATYANFALDDGSCHSYSNVSHASALTGVFLFNRWYRGHGDYFPADLAE